MNSFMFDHVARVSAAVATPWPTTDESLIVVMYGQVVGQIFLRFE